MFRRAHHLRIESLLRDLDAPLLAEHRCWFGGGTAIALSHGEYRESVDVDFIVSDQPSYRALRQIIREHGLDGICAIPIAVVRAPAIDQYGIRSAVLSQGVTIKLEIVHEGRIELDQPGRHEEICGVRTLAAVDQVATKLLANDDRWADTSVFSRDLIDLAMLRPSNPALAAGAQKAASAYGPSVGESLRKAIDHLRQRPQRLDECIQALRMELPRASVWQSIRDFEARCATVPALAATR